MQPGKEMGAKLFGQRRLVSGRVLSRRASEKEEGGRQGGEMPRPIAVALQAIVAAFLRQRKVKGGLTEGIVPRIRRGRQELGRELTRTKGGALWIMV